MAIKDFSLIHRYRNWRRYRTTIRALERLSPRELDDIGICRSDIERIARRSVL